MKCSPKCRTKKIRNDLHHFGKFLLIIESGRGRYLAPNQARENKTPQYVFMDILNIGPDRQNNLPKIANIFFSININICFGCSKERSYRDGSFEYP